MFECVNEIKPRGESLGTASVSKGWLCMYQTGRQPFGAAHALWRRPPYNGIIEIRAVSLLHRSVQLNGQPLVMVDDGTLPELKPRPLRAGRTLVIPPVTMGFYVVKNVNALACRYR